MIITPPKMSNMIEPVMR